MCVSVHAKVARLAVGNEQRQPFRLGLRLPHGDRQHGAKEKERQLVARSYKYICLYINTFTGFIFIYDAYFIGVQLGSATSRL